MMDWNQIDVNIRNSASCNVFKRVILKFTRPEPNKVFNVESISGSVDNIDDTRLESITSLHGPHQIINEPTHILPSSSSCIDLIFT